MLNEFSHVFAYLILGIIFTAGGLITNYFIRPNHPNRLKLSIYECGEDPIGDGQIKFNIRFFVVSLIFILFDVELVFLFPWAVVYKQMGFAYAWVKGDLDWVRPEPYVARLDDLISRDVPRTLRPAPTVAAPTPEEVLAN
jgi:NADH-quinone oxidoreductase subunit A